MSSPIRTVRVVLPSSPVPQVAPFEAGVAWLESHGVEVRLPLPTEPGPMPHLAGSDSHRAGAMASALEEEGVDVVWCGRGGSGALRTLTASVSDRAMLGPRSSRPLIGLSDATALLLARHALGGVAVHGPVITQLARLDEPSQRALVAWLRAPHSYPALHGTLGQGSAKGPVVAGNLSLMASVCGTPEQASLADGILLLEEIAEPVYRVDRMMAQLERSGTLRGLAGLALGTFEGCHDDVEECLVAWARRMDVPWIAGLPVGHGAACVPVLLGGEYVLQGDGEAPSLSPTPHPAER